LLARGIILASVTVMLALAGGVPAARANGVILSTSSIRDSSLDKGAVVNVPFFITNTVAVFAWQLNATWDPSALTVLNFTLGNHWKYSSAAPSITVFNLNNTSGSFLYGMSFYGIATGPPMPTGSTVLVSVAFKVLHNNVQTRIHIVTVSEDQVFGTIILEGPFQNWNCHVVNRDGEICVGSPYSTVDGYFSNVHSHMETLPPARESAVGSRN
jgi:hypothetical protein